MSNGDVERPVSCSPDERSDIRVRSTSFYAAPGFHCVHPGYERNKGSETPANAGQYLPHQTGAVAPRIKRLAPPVPLSGALACRRSTTVLPRGCVVPWCDPGQASWINRPRGGGHSADDRPTSSDAPRTPVVMPAGMMPGPPGSQADEASPAGTALAPAARHHPDGVPLGRDDSLYVTERGTNVKSRSQ